MVNVSNVFSYHDKELTDAGLSVTVSPHSAWSSDMLSGRALVLTDGNNNNTDEFVVLTKPLPGASGNILAYVFVPVGVIFLIGFIIFGILLLIRKTRLDRLRHHLMPMYSFTPTEEGDWESDLLEEEREQHAILKIPSPSEEYPRLKFAADKMNHPY